MTDFPINFSALGKDYHANVHRTSSVPVQYHVSDLQPSDFKIPSPYLFSANKGQHRLDFSSFGFNYSREIGSAISKAILDACTQRGIPLYDESDQG